MMFLIFHLQDKLVRREALLAAAIESLNMEELKLDEKHRELDEVQAAYDVLMQQRQVRCPSNSSLRVFDFLMQSCNVASRIDFYVVAITFLFKSQVKNIVTLMCCLQFRLRNNI